MEESCEEIEKYMKTLGLRPADQMQERNEEMSREIWELSKINADLQNRLNYVPFLQEENHRLHLALNAEKQKLQKLSQQCGVGIPLEWNNAEINDETEPQI